MKPMNWLYATGMKWGLGLLYLGIAFLLLLVLPSWLRWPLLVLFLLSFIQTYFTQERSAGRYYNLRPLTRWDVPGDPTFLQRLDEASDSLGLRRRPVWAVAESDWMNAMAVGGTRGVVVFTTAMLKQMPPDELLAVAGHELSHIRSRDSLPALVGGSWMGTIGQFSELLARTGSGGRGHWAAGIVGLIGIFLDMLLLVVGALAEAVLAKRSRLQEHMADLTGARVASLGAMIAALSRLEAVHPSRASNEPRWSPVWIAQHMHASHPPTPERIAFLQRAAERGEVVA